MTVIGKHPLRDLAGVIERAAAAHPAYSQAQAIISNACDHLCAVARTHEVALAEVAESATKREQAVAKVKEIFAGACGCGQNCQFPGGEGDYCGCWNDARNAIIAYERVMTANTEI